MDTYVLRPRRDRGFTLTGAAIPDHLWFLCDAAAANYAAHCCRAKGGRLVVLRRRGDCELVEHYWPAAGLTHDSVGSGLHYFAE